MSSVLPLSPPQPSSSDAHAGRETTPDRWKRGETPQLCTQDDTYDNKNATKHTIDTLTSHTHNPPRHIVATYSKRTTHLILPACLLYYPIPITNPKHPLAFRVPHTKLESYTPGRPPSEKERDQKTPTQSTIASSPRSIPSSTKLG